MPPHIRITALLQNKSAKKSSPPPAEFSAGGRLVFPWLQKFFFAENSAIGSVFASPDGAKALRLVIFCQAGIIPGAVKAKAAFSAGAGIFLRMEQKACTCPRYRNRADKIVKIQRGGSVLPGRILFG